MTWQTTVILIFGFASCKQSDPVAPPAQASAEHARQKAPSAPREEPIAAPEPGKGNLEGKVLHAGEPAAGIEVKLCETFDSLAISGPACGGAVVETKTDASGRYVFRDLAPRTYGGVMVRVFDSETYAYATQVGETFGATKQVVTAGQTKSVAPTNLVKRDLVVTGPCWMARTVPAPPVRWAGYPRATSYRVSIKASEDESASPPVEGTVTATTFTPPTPLAPGRWTARVVAVAGDPKHELEIAQSTPCEFIVPTADDSTPLDDEAGERPARPERPALPTVTSPALEPATGAVQGLILYDERPAAGLAVKLCETFSSYSGCAGKKLVTTTDATGAYTFNAVPPSEWEGLTVRVFATKDELYIASGLIGAKRHVVTAGSVLSVPPTRLFKSDLRVTSPKAGAKLKTRRFPLTWAAYPGAASYRVSLVANPYRQLGYDLEVVRPSFVLDKPLDNGNYTVTITALNAWGHKLATSDRGVKFSVAADSP